MRQWLRKLVQGLVLGALLALLFLYPQAAMQGVREGLSLWANAVLPALLPFFVLTSLLLESGMLRLLAPLAGKKIRVKKERYAAIAARSLQKIGEIVNEL